MVYIKWWMNQLTARKCDQPSQRADKQEVKDNLCSSLEQMNFLFHVNLLPGLQGVECAAVHLEYRMEVLVSQVLLWKWERTAISITITMKMCVGLRDTDHYIITEETAQQ